MTTSPKPTKDEALKLALDALQAASDLYRTGLIHASQELLESVPKLRNEAMTAIREALAQPAADDKAGGELSDDVCSFCAGSGVVTGMTSHLGPDDYEFDTDCEACHGTGSADVRDAIKALSYQPHTVKTGVQMVDRAAVLRIIDARVALLAADYKAGGEADQGWKMVPVQATHNILAAAKQPGSWGEKWQRMVAASPNYTRPQPQADQPAERVALTDEMDAEELALFKSTVDDFDDCGETSTPDATLMDWARRGYLDCVRFETTEKAHKMLATLPDDSDITGRDKS